MANGSLHQARDCTRTFTETPDISLGALIRCSTSGTPPSSVQRGCLTAGSPQKVHRIKQNPQLLGCALFSVITTLRDGRNWSHFMNEATGAQQGSATHRGPSPGKWWIQTLPFLKSVVLLKALEVRTRSLDQWLCSRFKEISPVYPHPQPARNGPAVYFYVILRCR